MESDDRTKTKQNVVFTCQLGVELRHAYAQRHVGREAPGRSEHEDRRRLVRVVLREADLPNVPVFFFFFRERDFDYEKGQEKKKSTSGFLSFFLSLSLQTTRKNKNAPAAGVRGVGRALHQEEPGRDVAVVDVDLRDERRGGLHERLHFLLEPVKKKVLSFFFFRVEERV